jgi:hypothetical protein
MDSFPFERHIFENPSQVILVQEEELPIDFLEYAVPSIERGDPFL